MRRIYVELTNEILFNYFKRETIELDEILDVLAEYIEQNKSLEQENDNLSIQLEDIKVSVDEICSKHKVDTQVDKI